MRVDGQHLAVELEGSCLISRFFVGLRLQAQDERVALIGFLQIGDGGLVVAFIKGNVAGQVRKKAGLVGVIGLIQGGFGGGDMLAGLIALSAASSDAGLRMLPAKFP